MIGALQLQTPVEREIPRIQLPTAPAIMDET